MKLRILLIAGFFFSAAASTLAQSSVELSGESSAILGQAYTYDAVFKNSSGQVVSPPTLMTEGYSWIYIYAYSLSFSQYSTQLVWTATGNQLLQYEAHSWDNFYQTSRTITVTNPPAPGEGEPASALISGPISVTAGTPTVYNVTFKNFSGQQVTPQLSYSQLFLRPNNSENSIQESSTFVYQVQINVPGNYTVEYFGETPDDHRELSYSLPVTSLISTPIATAATTITSNSFIANWIANGATGYRLDVASDINFQLMVPGFNNLLVGTTSKLVTGLEAGKPYYYRVRAEYGSQVSISSNPINQNTIPGSPIANEATNFTSTSFQANWSGETGADFYRVELSENSSFSPVMTTYDVYGATFKSITGLVPGTRYYYRVASMAWFGQSAPSNSKEALTIPEIPILSSATDITSSSFKIDWTTVKGATGYWIEVALIPSYQQRVISQSVNGIDFVASNLTAGSKYYYHVRAYNSSGSSPYSSTILASIPPVSPLAKEANDVTLTSFRANWEAASGAYDYDVELSSSPTFSPLVSAYNTKLITTIYINLQSEKSFYYRVFAKTQDGVRSLPSNAIHTATLTRAPVATTATNVLANSFTANWIPTIDADYLLDVSIDPSFGSFVDGYNSRIVSGDHAQVTGLSLNSNYYYRLRGRNVVKLPSGYSNSVEVTQTGHNFIKTTIVTASGLTTLAAVEDASINKRMISNQFLDGLGRKEQVVNVKGSPAYNDIVQPVVYDAYGREAMHYLPYVSTENTGWFKPNPVGNTQSPYINSAQYKFYENGAANGIALETMPLSQTVFEPSPLNRVMKDGAPGAAWQPTDIYSMADKTIKKRYELNTENEVIVFRYDPASQKISVSTLTSEKYYAANQLYANKTYDEKNNEVFEYVDKEGRMVCKKVYEKTENNVRMYAETYYLYDDFGNLIAVLPPMALDKLKPILIND